MPTKLQRLEDERRTVARAMRNLNDTYRGSSWTALHASVFDAHMAVVDRLDGEITEERRRVEADALSSRGIAELDQRVMLNTYVRAGEAHFSESQRAVYNEMSTSIGSAGGFTVTSAVARELVDALKDYGGVRRVARVMVTSNGAPLSVPTSDGTSETGEQQDQAFGVTFTGSVGGATSGTLTAAIANGTFDATFSNGDARTVTVTGGTAVSWTGALAAGSVTSAVFASGAASSLDPSFGSAALNTYKFTSKVMTVPLELLQDSEIDIVAFTLQRGAARIGRVTNSKFTIGSGSDEPQGLVTAAGAGKTGATGETISVVHDDLIDLVSSVNVAYRRASSSGVAWMMADSTFKAIRKLKDDNHRPLYLPDDGTEGETLLGYPVDLNDDIPIMSANAKSIFFGAFGLGYTVRDALQVSLLRYEDSAFVMKGQIGFEVIARCGGAVSDSGAIKYFQNSAT